MRFFLENRNIGLNRKLCRLKSRDIHYRNDFVGDHFLLSAVIPVTI